MAESGPDQSDARRPARPAPPTGPLSGEPGTDQAISSMSLRSLLVAALGKTSLSFMPRKLLLNLPNFYFQFLVL